MAKILKSRYFDDTNVLNAPLKKKASHIWKSLFQGRNLLKEGLRFVSGYGSMVNAWYDPWLSLHPPRPSKPRIMIGETYMVKDWMNDT